VAAESSGDRTDLTLAELAGRLDEQQAQITRLLEEIAGLRDGAPRPAARTVGHLRAHRSTDPRRTTTPGDPTDPRGGAVSRRGALRALGGLAPAVWAWRSARPCSPPNGRGGRRRQPGAGPGQLGIRGDRPHEQRIRFGPLRRPRGHQRGRSGSCRPGRRLEHPGRDRGCLQCRRRRRRLHDGRRSAGCMEGTPAPRAGTGSPGLRRRTGVSGTTFGDYQSGVSGWTKAPVAAPGSPAVPTTAPGSSARLPAVTASTGARARMVPRV